jgi:hypothetical protein
LAREDRRSLCEDMLITSLLRGEERVRSKLSISCCKYRWKIFVISGNGVGWELPEDRAGKGSGDWVADMW